MRDESYWGLLRQRTLQRRRFLAAAAAGMGITGVTLTACSNPKRVGGTRLAKDRRLQVGLVRAIGWHPEYINTLQRTAGPSEGLERSSGGDRRSL